MFLITYFIQNFTFKSIFNSWYLKPSIQKSAFKTWYSKLGIQNTIKKPQKKPHSKHLRLISAFFNIKSKRRVLIN